MHMNATQGLWPFALALYGDQGVQSACLALQDQSGHRVNLLLGALWLTANARRIDGDKAQIVRAKSDHWHNSVMKPLRVARRNFLDGASAFGGEDTECRAQRVRAELKASELVCERFEIERLDPLLRRFSIETSWSPLLGWTNFDALTPWREDDSSNLKILLTAVAECHVMQSS